MRKIINKKHTTIMMAGSLVGYSFMGAKNLLQEADMAVGIIKETVADKERTKKSANNVGIQYVLDKYSIGELGYTVCKAKNIDIGIVLIDKQQKEEDIRQCISDAKSSGAEFILGYVASDIIDDGIGAKKIAEAGADYILGYGKKKVGPYSLVMTEEGKQVPVLYSLGNLGGKQGKVMIMELQLMKDRHGTVIIKSEGYHPCLADGKIALINDALKVCSDQEERIDLEDALLSIKTSMGINERCICCVEDKALSSVQDNSYSSLQKKYEVQPIVTAKKKQIKHPVGDKRYRYDKNREIYITDNRAAEREATIMCTGLIGYDRLIEEDAECFGHYEFRKSFKAVSQCFSGADFVFGNLNSMASGEYPSISEVTKRTEASGYRNCRVEFLEALRDAGFTGIAAANAYNAGIGIEGIIDTQKTIENCDMIAVGIGYDKAPVVEINGIKIGFISVTTDCPGVKNNLTGEAADKFLSILDGRRTNAEIKAAKRKGAEFILAYINCGEGEQLSALEERKHVAETVANMGADYVICTGTGDVSEYYHFVDDDGRAVPIATSLGYFIAGSEEGENFDGAVIELRVRRSFDGSIRFEDNYIPIKVFDKLEGIQHVIMAAHEYFNESYREDMYRETEQSVSIGLGTQIQKNHKRISKISEGFTKNFTIAELYEFFGKTPDEKDIERFGDKYHEQISFFTAKEDAIQEGCVAILYDYINYGKTEEFEWDIKKCVEKGVVLLIDNKPHDELPCIVVDEPLIDVYRKMSNHIIKQYEPVKVAITGSMGKTTTKEMTVEVFNNHFKTLTNSGNLNVIFNIGLMIQKLQDDDGAYIQEVHGGTIGMASDISKMIEPDICILTNIEKNHMSQVGTVENLIASKMGIIDGLKPDGVLIACKDNQHLRDMDPPVRTIKYSVSDPSCHYYARNIRSDGEDLLFDIVVNESEFDHEGIYAARINMQGEHNVANAIAAFAAGRQAGIPPHEIVAGLSRYRTSGIRQNIFEHNGIKMIMDTHNSNPVALLNMFDVFDGFEPKKGGRKILVLGMMGEQGDASQQIHYDTGKAISEHDFDLMLCFGEDAKYMVQAAKECGKEAYYFSDRAVFNRTLAENVKPGDVVMVKGSHALKLDTATMVPIFGKNIRSH